MINSILFNIYTYLVTYFLFIAGMPLMFFGSRGILFGCRLWAKTIIYGAKYIVGIDYEVIGKAPTKPVIIASKHQSAWETAFFWMVLPKPCFILKRELVFIPFLGIYLLLANQIWLNRSRGASSIKKMLRQGRKRLAEGKTIIIFPEGTRTKPGTKVKYKSGVATLYANLNTQVVPVRLNSGECWPRNSFLKKPGKITVEFLEPMQIGLTKQGFMHELEKRIEGK